MDFGALPPEINSARMYAGAGAGPMLTAAASWDGLATQLHGTADSYGAVVSGLTGGPWRGAASASMEAAIAPHIGWLRTTAAQAEEAAVQAKMAVTSFETAFAMTVPLPLIAANRAQLMSLVAANVLGQNTPAIAATEVHYGEMWAQDAAAMYSYAAASATASRLTPFTAPVPTTNPAGLAGQAAAVAHAAGSSAATGAKTIASSAQLISGVPGALQAMAAPAGGKSMLAMLDLAVRMISLGMYPMSASMGMLSSMMKSATGPVAHGVGNAATALGAGVAGGLKAGAGALESAGASVSAGMGQATSIGALSAPSSWGTAVPAAAGTVTALPGTGAAAASAAAPAVPPGMLGGMPMTQMAGGAGSAESAGIDNRFGPRRFVMPRIPAAG